jgi:predicted DNA-binding transcriptional regulator AlpA
VTVGNRSLPTPQERPTLKVVEAASIVGVGVSTYYEGVARGTLPALKLSPRRIVVPTAALWDLLGMEVPSDGA